MSGTALALAALALAGCATDAPPTPVARVDDGGAGAWASTLATGALTMSGDGARGVVEGRRASFTALAYGSYRVAVREVEGLDSLTENHGSARVRAAGPPVSRPAGEGRWDVTVPVDLDYATADGRPLRTLDDRKVPSRRLDVRVRVARLPGGGFVADEFDVRQAKAPEDRSLLARMTGD